MSALRSTDDICSINGRNFVTERAADPINRSYSETDEVKPTLIRARISEVRSDQQTDLGEEYHFEQLPARNDQIVILNRRGSYDIMKVLYSANEPEATVYVRWVARLGNRGMGRFQHVGRTRRMVHGRRSTIVEHGNKDVFLFLAQAGS